MNFTILLLVIINLISADLISWNRQRAISQKSRQYGSRSSSSYQDLLLAHMLKTGDTENARRLIAYIHSRQ